MNEVSPVAIGAERREERSQRPRIYPIVVYPYRHPGGEQRHLRRLYEWLSGLDVERFLRPLTVVNRQTRDRVANVKMTTVEQREAREAFERFLGDTVAPRSDVIDAWCVDTCQMWLAGLGKRFDEKQAPNAVYWLIPGDFEYDGDSGKAVLAEMMKLPLVVDEERGVELALGEIKVPPNSSKQLIDTYGTYGLLYNWFPVEAQGIREITNKPRTEFLAIGENYLHHVLAQRWYAYEQTIVILLHGMNSDKPGRGIRPFQLGEIGDDEAARKGLEGAMQQVERTERVLKLFWRERHQFDYDWQERFRRLDAQSEQIRGAAMVIFEQVLR